MEDMTRREAIQKIAATLAIVVKGGTVVASEPQAMGNGPCRVCNCRGYWLSSDGYCQRCGHHYNQHRNIHTFEQV